MRRGGRLATALLAHLGTTAAGFRLPAASAGSLGAALRGAAGAFEAAGVPEPRLSAQHLLTRAAGFGSSRGRLDAQLDTPLEPSARARFEAMCAQRLERVPVQYILGDWDFHDLTLQVRAPVLIPRPETEQLVEMVLDAHAGGPGGRDRPLRLLDVGCGSGAIGLALLQQLPNARCVAIDLSAEAVALATENARLCGLDARFTAILVPDGIEGFARAAPGASADCDADTDGGGDGGDGSERFDVVVSNPPYIPAADMAGLAPEVREHEDRQALCGGADGADVVRLVLRAAPRLLRARGPRAIWLEVDPSHPALLRKWLEPPATASDAGAAMPMRLVQVHDDLNGLERFCHVELDDVCE